MSQDLRDQRTDDNRRILLIDDNVAIHEDIRKILIAPPVRGAVDDLENELFGADPNADLPSVTFTIDSATQGREGLECVRQANLRGLPYALAIVDMRMPPGWDGLETIRHLWKEAPDLQILICTAYADNPWDEVKRTLGRSDGLLILKKPFDGIEVSQMAHALTEKWNLARRARLQLEDLETAVRIRTRCLEEATLRLHQEIVERERMEVALRLAQKLEAVGQLAAGIAHEINTPIQFIGDSLEFLREACGGLASVLTAHTRLCQAVERAGGFEDLVGEIRRTEEAADLAYLSENIPPSLARVADGASRVATIVRSLKDFAHPDATGATAADLNRGLESTLVMARSEYRDVADVETAFGELPAVVCYGSDLNQVFLNLIVNAAHAIGDVVRQNEGRGTIRVRTSVDGDEAVIAIGDTGSGIPPEIQRRIFDPFFTTKGIGKGTGQGLSIARSIVVDKHKGSLTFETEPGRGTTFFIRVPIAGPPTEATQVA